MLKKPLLLSFLVFAPVVILLRDVVTSLQFAYYFLIPVFLGLICLEWFLKRGKNRFVSLCVSFLTFTVVGIVTFSSKLAGDIPSDEFGIVIMMSIGYFVLGFITVSVLRVIFTHYFVGTKSQFNGNTESLNSVRNTEYKIVNPALKWAVVVLSAIVAYYFIVMILRTFGYIGL